MKKQKVSVIGTMLTIEYPTIGKKFVADFSKYPAEMRTEALAHGFKQKFGDAKSGGTPAEKYAEVQLIHASLMDGNWERTGTADHSAIIIEAICNLKKLKEEKVRKAVEANPDKVKEWGSNPQVKAEVARIRAERAAKVADESEEELEIDL